MEKPIKKAPKMGGGPGAQAAAKREKPKNTRQALLGIWAFLGKRKALLVIAFIMVLVSNIASLASNNYLQPLIDNFLQPTDGGLSAAERLTGLYRGLMVMMGIALIAIASSYLQNRLMMELSQRTIADVRRKLFDHLQGLPVRYFDTHTTGELMSRFTNDVDTLNDALQNGLTTLFSSAVTVLGIFCLMLYHSIPLTLITLLIVPVLLLSTGAVVKISSQYFAKQQAALGDVNGYIEEMMTGQKVIKTFCYEERAKAAFEEKNRVLAEAAQTAQGYAGMMIPIARNINNVAYAVVAAAGGIFTIFGNMTVGSLVVFLIFVQNFGRPLNEASSQYNSIITAIAGAERILQVLKETPENIEETQKQNTAPVSGVKNEFVLVHGEGRDFFWEKDGTRVAVRGDVRFENVEFGYSPEKKILNGVSLYAKPGQKIAFVGSTGAGKTTIINLLTRFYDVDAGRITADGIDIRDIARGSLRNAMAVVLQDTHLFTGTVYDNIRYGRPGATDAEVEEAAKLACADGFIKRLKHGYNTVIEGDGANLSQGQRQLLNIARAAVADSPILILDEATSSVDTRTERLIEIGLDRLMEGRTTFVIAHRLSTVRNSNAIMVMEHGTIIERGTHDDLLAQGGRYYQLYTGAAELD